MVISGYWQSRPVTISVKSNCLTVSVETGAGPQVFSFDYAGRPWTALLDGISYRRGLDGKILAKWHTVLNQRERRWLTPEEGLQMEARTHQAMSLLLAALQSNTVQLATPMPEQGWLGIQRAIAFDATQSKADAEHYRRIYKPVGILPPDQYMAVVLQATEGCSFNTCTFCSFYRDRAFRIKRADEFRSHAQAVRLFLGEGLSLRRTIFLGDANALVTPMPLLLSLLDVANEEYDVTRLGGIYAFLDGFSGERKNEHDYAALAAHGLRRVYIGMESGNEALLAFLKKPGKPGDVVRAVQAMKAGGVAVGIIILLGAGGRQFASDHVRDTIAAINAIQLGMDDIIYFSELVIREGMEYAHDAYQAQLEPLTALQRIAQGEMIEAGLRFTFDGGTPHISRYDIREFVY